MKKTVIKILSSVLIIFLSAQMAFLWKEQMHRDQLTQDALHLIRAKDGEKYGFELWGEYQEFIQQGAWDEDFPCGGSGLRANNHYRHALTGHALSDAPFIGMGETDHDALTWAKTNPDLSTLEEFDSGKQWEGFKKYQQEYGWTPMDVFMGEMSWKEAVNRYGYTQNSKRLAYYTMGFSLHLLQDMACPEHVHDDPHGASGYTGFEMWVFQNWARIRKDPESLTIKKLPSIDAYFINLSKLGYSIGRFHGGTLNTSSPHINPTTDLAQMFTIDYSMGEYELSNPNGEDIMESYANIDFEWDPEDYRKNPLWHKGHDEGEWWPTHVEIPGNNRNDKEGFYYIELSGELPGEPWGFVADVPRHLFPNAFLPYPLLDVEDQCKDWREPNTQGQNLYFLIGLNILPKAVEHTAGLIEHYHDLVNHPPFVRRVDIYQAGEKKYSAYWEDKLEIVPSTDTIKRVEERSLEKDKNERIVPGELTFIVKFSEPVRDIEIKLEEAVVDGTLNQEEDLWTGKLKVKPGGPNIGEQKLRIQARDKHLHYVSSSDPKSDDVGFLDADPETPAYRECSADSNHNLSYKWKGYKGEKGGGDALDVSHTIDIESRLYVDPIRIRVVNQAGTPITDVPGLVQIAGSEARISESEYWGTHEFRDFEEVIDIAASQALPDGSVATAKATLAAKDFEDWSSPSAEPITLTLPVFDPGSFTVSGVVKATAPPEKPYPGRAVLENNLTGSSVGVIIPGGEKRFNPIELIMSDIFVDATPTDGSFHMELDEFVRAGSSITLTASGSTTEGSFQGEKSLPVPLRPGNIDFGVITISPITDGIRVPDWNSDNPPAFPDYKGRLSGAGLAGQPVLGSAAPEGKLQHKVSQTNPGPGAIVRRGSTVAVVLFGKYAQRVPDLIGVKIDQALELLEDKGFKGQPVIGEAADTQSRESTVYWQSTRGGHDHPPDVSIQLKVYGKYTPSYFVPEITGLKEKEAREKVEGAHLEMEVVERSMVSADETQQGRVYKQEPRANQRVGGDTKVKAWVYAKPGEIEPPPDIRPKKPYYAAFQLTILELKDNVKLERGEEESDEAWRRRKQAAYSALTINNFNLKPESMSERPFTIHVSGDALDAYPSSLFTPDANYACRINLTVSDEGKNINIKGALLLTFKEFHDTMDELTLAYPVLKTDEDLKTFGFRRRDGTTEDRFPQGSVRLGPITKGWTEEDKNASVEFWKNFYMLYDCFIATAIYTDPDAPQLKVLRAFRDNFLLSSESGIHLMELYYIYGARLGSQINRVPGAPAAARQGMDIFVSWLGRVNLRDSRTRALAQVVVTVLDETLCLFLDSRQTPLEEFQKIIIHSRLREAMEKYQ